MESGEIQVTDDNNTERLEPKSIQHMLQLTAFQAHNRCGCWAWEQQGPGKMELKEHHRDGTTNRSTYNQTEPKRPDCRGANSDLRKKWQRRYRYRTGYRQEFKIKLKAQSPVRAGRDKGKSKKHAICPAFLLILASHRIHQDKPRGSRNEPAPNLNAARTRHLGEKA